MKKRLPKIKRGDVDWKQMALELAVSLEESKRRVLQLSYAITLLELDRDRLERELHG